MARIGDHPYHSALNAARDDLKAALRRTILVSGTAELLVAIEAFIDAKIEDKRDPRY